ncbi:MAG TPA: Gfo/Idh/MocA family oxidoreductase [Candidatus Latescibacteria bacterium]|nr:Gfo/Idh/MocA family oxidoreductase [Candidatus Latescibacterota bacterium]
MPVKVGIIGCGAISQFHLRGYRKAGAEITAVCDADESLAKRRASSCGAKYFTDYKDLWNQKEIEALSVCVPNFLHYRVALDALEAGKHVLCEKADDQDLERSRGPGGGGPENGTCLSGRLYEEVQSRFHPHEETPAPDRKDGDGTFQSVSLLSAFLLGRKQTEQTLAASGRKNRRMRPSSQWKSSVGRDVLVFRRSR